MNLLIRILHLKRKSPNNTRNSTPELRPRKVLPNTRSLTMQEGNLSKVRRRASIVIRYLIPILVCIDPSLGVELFRVISPEQWASVYRPRTENDPRTCRDEFPRDGGVPHCFADGGWDGRPEAEDFLAYSVEERERLEVLVCDLGVAARDLGSDLFAQSCLVVRVLVEKVGGPGQGAGGGFMLDLLASVFE